MISRRHHPSSPRGAAVRCCCSSSRSLATSSPAGTAAGSAAQHTNPTTTVAAAAVGSLRVRVRLACPRDAAVLAALDASCAADGSSGWSEGIYQADLRPGGPNLILLCELLPSVPPSSASSPPRSMRPPPPPQSPAAQPGADVRQAVSANALAADTEPRLPESAAEGRAAAEEGAVAAAAADTAAADAAEAGTEPLAVVALAAGCEVAGEVSLTNLAVAAAVRGAGLGRRMACELLAWLGAERYPTFLEVRKDNAAAQALYGRLGFDAVGVRKRYNPDGSDSLVMVRHPAPLAWPPSTATLPPSTATPSS